MSENHTQDISKHLKVYVGVFVALLIGTLLTVAASRIHFGHEGNIIVALVIAVIKAGLVALFFMHLVSEKKSIYMILAFTAIFFVGLMFLTVWAMHDFPVLTLK
ncbi:MAG: cytochrome C oxidase subunit IV family protein [Limisphaerales bacterium]